MLIVVNAIIESPNWLVLAGLVFDILGVGLIAWGMVASKSKIVEQLEPAPTDWMRKSSYTVKKSAGYLDRLWQSRTALGGPVCWPSVSECKLLGHTFKFDRTA